MLAPVQAFSTDHTSQSTLCGYEMYWEQLEKDYRGDRLRDTAGQSFTPKLGAALLPQQYQGWYHCAIQFIGALKSPYLAMAQMNGSGKGRTAVHEVGHYLGLSHIFRGASNPTCTVAADDGIDDTPLQAIVTTVADATKNTCHTGQVGDLPDLWENYMDYTP